MRTATTGTSDRHAVGSGAANSRLDIISLSASLYIFFIYTCLLWAHPETPGAMEGFKALWIIGILLAFMAMSSYQEACASCAEDEVPAGWWRDKLLAVCLASGFSALTLDGLALLGAGDLFTSSSNAMLSLKVTFYAASASCVLLIVSAMVNRPKMFKLKSLSLNCGVAASLAAVFSEIGLVMSVKEPVLPHYIAIYERLATFFLVLALAIFVLFRLHFSLARDEV